VIAPHSPIRLVLDTNVLLRALANRASVSRRVVAACEARRAIALLSKPVHDEYRLVLFHLPERDDSITLFDIQAQLRKLKYLSEYFRNVRASFVFPRDPADAMLIELAIDAGATHIVSYDAELNEAGIGERGGAERGGIMRGHRQSADGAGAKGDGLGSADLSPGGAVGAVEGAVGAADA